MRKFSKSETCFFSTETDFYRCKIVSNIKLKQNVYHIRLQGPPLCVILILNRFIASVCSFLFFCKQTANETASKNYFNFLYFMLLGTLSSVCTISFAMFVFGNNHTLLGCTILNQFPTGFRQHILLVTGLWFV